MFLLVRRAKSDDTSSSSDPEIASDYESPKVPRGRKNKGRKKKSSRSRGKKECILMNDDSDSDKARKSRRRRIKKGNRQSGYLSTRYLNGESTTPVDSDSSSSKSKKSKESKESKEDLVKKSRVVKENEAIRRYLGSSGGGGGGSRVRSRDSVNEGTRSRKIDPSPCAKETVQRYSIKGVEVVQQLPSKEPPVNQPSIDPVIQQQKSQPIYQTVIERTDGDDDDDDDDDVPVIQSKHEYTDKLIQRKSETHLDEIVLNDESNDQMESSSSCVKRKYRISSSESEADNYEGKYFGWERGKKIVEIIDWYGYKDKVLHLVEYEDGEHEYVDDAYTCINYPYMVYEMYKKSINDETLDGDLQIWINYAVQRFQQFGQSVSQDEDSSQNGFDEDSTISETVTDQPNGAKSEVDEEESSGQSEYSSEENQTLSNENSDESRSQENGEQAQEDEEEEEEEESVEDEEEENDENNQNTHNFDASSSSSNSTRMSVGNGHEETGISVLVVNSSDESIGQNDSVFIVQSDSSCSQMVQTNQPIEPEFVIEESDLEDNLLNSSERIPTD